MFFGSFCLSNDLLCCSDGYYGGRNGNYTSKSIYIQLGFVVNVPEDDNILLKYVSMCDELSLIAPNICQYAMCTFNDVFDRVYLKTTRLF